MSQKIKEAKERWEQETLKEARKKRPERQQKFTTLSFKEVPIITTPLDVEGFDYLKELGFPGEYPFTRGVQATMYRGRLWTMRQFAGMGTPAQTNQRYRYLLEQGQTGLSVAFHYPTLMGRDSDDPRSEGEIGKCGVAIDTLQDMEILFDKIPLDKITTSMTINGPAAILWAMYIAVAEKQGVDSNQIGGTIQNDILKEYIAQKSWIFPPKPSIRLITDTIEYGTQRVKRWNTISISGYHIREAGATAIQELAFTLADGIAYVQAGIQRGLNVDEFAPRLSFFFDAHSDFFEEIAKFRAARRMWARIMKERFGAKNPQSLKLRFHTQTAGCTLTAQQPMNNIIRVAFQALSAVLGGTQSLHTNSMDETLALPTQEAVTIALRTQQIIAHETGAANTIDPLAGSYFVEYLTSYLESEAWQYIKRIDEMGGMVSAIEKGYPQREITEAAHRYQLEIEEGKRIIVGINEFIMSEDVSIPVLKIEPEVAETQIKNLKRIKQQRDSRAVLSTLRTIKSKAQTDENLMPFILEAVKAYATLGEICDVLREVFGEYQDPAEF